MILILLSVLYLWATLKTVKYLAKDQARKDFDKVKNNKYFSEPVGLTYGETLFVWARSLCWPGTWVALVTANIGMHILKSLDNIGQNSYKEAVKILVEKKEKEDETERLLKEHAKELMQRQSD